jgi:hypothetical protein
VRGPGGFQPVAVEVLARNPDEIAITGIDPDARVALVDPAAGGEGGAGGEGEAGDEGAVR